MLTPIHCGVATRMEWQKGVRAQVCQSSGQCSFSVPPQNGSTRQLRKWNFLFAVMQSCLTSCSDKRAHTIGLRSVGEKRERLTQHIPSSRSSSHVHHQCQLPLPAQPERGCAVSSLSCSCSRPCLCHDNATSLKALFFCVCFFSLPAANWHCCVEPSPLPPPCPQMQKMHP